MLQRESAMSATAQPSIERSAIDRQVERLIESPGLQNSEALRNLLRYLVSQRLDRPHDHVKEYQIALDVLGRADSFDPRIDSAVRVQTSRLRNKLIEYYATAGSSDPVLIDIPKGTYSPVFQLRPQPVSISEAPGNHPMGAPAEGRSLRLWMAAVIGLSVLMAASLLVARMLPRAKSAAPRSGEPVTVFWQGFLDSDAEPLVVFSNAEFVGRPETGLRYFTSGRDAPEAVFDHYTGVGEVLSVHQLDQVFQGLNRRVQVKRGRLLSWDDAQNRDLVFLGSPSENLSLRDLPLGREFRFEIIQAAPRTGDLGIVNLHPAAGEQAVYFGSGQLPITEDYALVELVRGAAPAQSILLLAGTTTFGTQGAVEFVCNGNHLRELLPRIRGANGALAPFTALLRIKVSRGVPVEGTLVALRTGR
jgi:hypothetical protein